MIRAAGKRRIRQGITTIPDRIRRESKRIAKAEADPVPNATDPARPAQE